MREMEKKDEPKKEQDQPEQASLQLIDKANMAAERLEKANEELGKLILRQEKLQVEKALGGHAEAGTPQKLDETPEEYAKRVMSGDVEREN